MSYILDALQRADAERERGRVPGLHTPTGLSADTSLTPHTRQAALPWRRLAVFAGLAGAAAVGWWWFSAGPAPAQPSTPDSGAAGATQTAPVRPPDQSTVSPETTLPAAPILAPAEPVRTPVASPRASAPTPAPALTTPSPAAPVPAAPSPAPQAVRRWAELPAETRAQLPTVSVSGSTWSKNPAHRMLIVNGQVLQEGQAIAPGLVLERIDPNSAVLNHRGLRYSISY
jgi:general secretion pathway protein B